MIVGIDLGTTNSLVAYYNEGKVEVIPNRLGKYLTPSVVCVDEKNNILVGEIAKEYGYMHPECCAKVFKRTMGTNKKYDLRDHSFSSEELSSFVLRSLIEDAEIYLKEKVDEAIISVPAYFNDNQRKATKKAGELIGLKVSRIINEPTASAIAYGVGENDKNERCMVFDLGGGTFDVSILEYYRNIMEVHAIAGDNNLGGEDFTAALMNLFLKKSGLSEIPMDLFTLSSIYKMSENAKCEFSEDDEVIMTFRIGKEIYRETITIGEYEKECKPLLQKISAPIEKSLRDARATLDDIDRVIMVGGATRLPIVKKFVENFLNNYSTYVVDPDKSVVIGAALQAAMKTRNKQIEEIVLTDVCPFTLGTEVIDFNGMFDEPGHYLPIIERNTIIPVSKKQTVYTAYDNQKKVTVKVLQGESRLARNNLRLGEITVDVPVGPKGQEAIDITYTYDVNSLLEVEVTVVSTKETKKIIIQNENNTVSEEEAKKRFELLQYLKQNPRDEEENSLALLRGNRVYEETLGKDKTEVENALFAFEKVLAEGSRIEIDRERKKLLELLDEIENQGVSIMYS